MNNDVETKVKDIIIKNVRLKIIADDINIDTDIINDLGFDSLMVIKLIVEFEEKFNIQFEDEDLSLETLRTYGLLEKFIINKIRIKCTC